MLLLKTTSFFKQKIYNCNNLTSFFLKKKFFQKFGCNIVLCSVYSNFSFHKLVEQHRKISLFYHYLLWEEEKIIRKKYFLRILLAFKKQRLSTVLSSTKQNFLLDFFSIKRHISVMLTFLNTQFKIDFDLLNSKFLIFLFFLTKINFFSKNISLVKTQVNKKKQILRNLFFLFIFSIHRFKFFFHLIGSSLNLSNSFIFSLNSFKNFKTRFPRRFFLLFYSPFKASFNHGFSMILFRKRYLFIKRVNFLISTFSKNVKRNSKIIKKSKLFSSKHKFYNISVKRGGLIFRKLKFILKLFKATNFRNVSFIKILESKKNKGISKQIFALKKNILIEDSQKIIRYFNLQISKKLKKGVQGISSVKREGINQIYSFLINYLQKFIRVLFILYKRSRIQKFFYYRPRLSSSFIKSLVDIRKKLLQSLSRLKFFKYSIYFIHNVFKRHFFYYFPYIIGCYSYFQSKIPKIFNIGVFDFLLKKKKNFNFKLKKKYRNILEQKPFSRVPFWDSKISKQIVIKQHSQNKSFLSYAVTKRKKIFNCHNVFFKDFFSFFSKINFRLVIFKFFSTLKINSFFFKFKKKGFFDLIFLTQIFDFFLYFLRRMRIIVNLFPYTEIFRVMCIYKFYPLILCFSGFFDNLVFFKKFIKISNFAVETMQSQFPIITFDHIFKLLTKKRKLFRLMSVNVFNIPLKAFSQKHLTKTQKLIFDAENNNLLADDSKKFVLTFSKRFKTHFLIKKKIKRRLHLFKQQRKVQLIPLLKRGFLFRLNNKKRKGFLVKKLKKNLKMRYFKYFIKKLSSLKKIPVFNKDFKTIQKNEFVNSYAYKFDWKIQKFSVSKNKLLKNLLNKRIFPPKVMFKLLMFPVYLSDVKIVHDYSYSYCLPDQFRKILSNKIKVKNNFLSFYKLRYSKRRFGTIKNLNFLFLRNFKYYVSDSYSRLFRYVSKKTLLKSKFFLFIISLFLNSFFLFLKFFKFFVQELLNNMIFSTFQLVVFLKETVFDSLRKKLNVLLTFFCNRVFLFLFDQKFHKIIIILIYLRNKLDFYKVFRNIFSLFSKKYKQNSVNFMIQFEKFRLIIFSYFSSFDFKIKNLLKFLNFNTVFYSKIKFLNKKFSFFKTKLLNLQTFLFNQKFKYSFEVFSFNRNYHIKFCKKQIFYFRLLKILKLKKIRSKKTIKLKKKRKLFRQKWKKLKKFFLESYFFSRFMKNLNSRYFWNRYGKSTLGALQVFENQNLLFFQKKLKRFQLSFSLDGNNSAVNTAFRFSFINCSYGCKILITKYLLLSSAFSSYTIFYNGILSKTKYAKPLIFFSRFISFEKLNFIGPWICLLKTFYIANKKYYFTFLFSSEKILEYFNIIFFFFKRGFFFFFF